MKNNVEDESAMPLNKLLLRYILIVTINLFFVLLFGYFISPFSKVGTISVEGNQHVYVQEIIDESGITKGDSLLKTRQNFVEIEEKILNEFPQVARSEITIDGLNSIAIEIKEYKTVAYLAKEEAYLKVLENGQVLDTLYPMSIGNQLVLSKFEEGEALNLMVQELKEVDERILNLISEIELAQTEKNPLFIQVYMNNGNRILSNIPDFSEKILYYPKMVQAVEGKKGVFDMEAGVYFTPFIDGESEESGMDEAASQEIEDIEG